MKLDIESYKQQVYPGSPISATYRGLIQFMQHLRTNFAQTSADFQVGNISPGYMDYTYFAFFDQTLRAKKLRFGIVLNHQQLRFELWLMAQNATAQAHYWDQYKKLSWNQQQPTMPKYSVLEVVIDHDPDFTDLDSLAASLVTKTLAQVQEIYPALG